MFRVLRWVGCCCVVARWPSVGNRRFGLWLRWVGGVRWGEFASAGPLRNRIARGTSVGSAVPVPRGSSLAMRFLPHRSESTPSDTWGRGWGPGWGRGRGRFGRGAFGGDCGRFSQVVRIDTWLRCSSSRRRSWPPRSKPGEQALLPRCRQQRGDPTRGVGQLVRESCEAVFGEAYGSQPRQGRARLPALPRPRCRGACRGAAVLPRAAR